MEPTDLQMAAFFTTAAERALAAGDADAAMKLAQHAQIRLDVALAPAVDRADREAEATAEFFRRALS